MERLPGFRDFYPEPLPQPDLWSADARQHIFDVWRKVAERYGFRRYDGPPLETLSLFTAKSGDEIVGQLYNFTDKGGREVALRPEMTPTLARMAGAYERNYKKPIKWYAIPQLFRYERHQKGRLREHFQFNADILGESDPSAEAELIALLIDSLRAFGLTERDFVIRLSSRNAWHDFFHAGHGEPERETEFYQVVDKLEREAPEVSEAKLLSLGFSLGAVREFIAQGKPTAELQTILENAAARGLDGFIKIDYGVIRGLAYYTGPVFEAFAKNSDLRAIAGGGRYDSLIKLIHGKVDLPALGFGMGDVVLLELLKEKQLLPPATHGIGVYCVIADESLRRDSLAFIQQLRNAGVAVEYPLTPAKPDKQTKRARELNAKFSVRLERDASGVLEIRALELRSREERVWGREAALVALNA